MKGSDWKDGEARMGPDVTARLRAFGEPLANAPNRPQSVTLHTSLGDVKVEVYCEEVPRSAENFLALCASGYYDGTIFHRNIKGFMIQVSAAAPAPARPAAAAPVACAQPCPAKPHRPPLTACPRRAATPPALARAARASTPPPTASSPTRLSTRCGTPSAAS